MTVIVAGNRIADVGKTGKVRVPRNAQIIDASGKFLIPGLWDMHAHTRTDALTRQIVFPLNIANGVTGIRDMAGDVLEGVTVMKATCDVHLNGRKTLRRKMIGHADRGNCLRGWKHPFIRSMVVSIKKNA